MPQIAESIEPLSKPSHNSVPADLQSPDASDAEPSDGPSCPMLPIAPSRLAAASTAVPAPSVGVLPSAGGGEKRAPGVSNPAGAAAAPTPLFTPPPAPPPAPALHRP